MQVDDLIQSFREFADDLNDNPFLWSTALVESYIDRIEDEVCSRRPLLMTSSDSDLCEVAVTSGTSLYPKHAAVREVFYSQFKAGSDSYDLYVTNLDELAFTNPNWREDTGPPKYLILTDSSVQIVPTPIEDGTLYFSVSHVPKIKSSVSGSFTINDTHHYNLVYGVLQLAFSKRDSDAFSGPRSSEYGAIFDRYFGESKNINSTMSVRTVRTDRPSAGWI